MKNEIGTRIGKIIKTFGETQKSFAFKSQTSRTSVSKWINGLVEPTYAYMHNICMAYPQLNGHWLITGLGSMVREENLHVNKLGNESQQVNFLGDNYDKINVLRDVNGDYHSTKTLEAKKELEQVKNELLLYKKLYEQSEFKIGVLEEKLAQIK